VLIRTWNLFHGNSVPVQRRAFLDEELRLATADDPDVLCVQEVPAWALGRFTLGDVAARPMLGPLPIPAAAGHALTALNHGVLRSAFSGQGDAVLLAPRVRLLEHVVLVLNDRAFRAELSTRLGLDVVARLTWAKERRIAQLLRLEAGGRTLALANLHATSIADKRIPDAEVLRAADALAAFARGDEPIVLAGDLNVRGDASPALAELTGPRGFSAALPGIDHVLVRGAPSSAPRRWPDERRLHEGRLLSDHAPVEVELELG
jgi:endonuclease/exonuclease/phosphatase family metal-dependent hydrolase